MFVSIFRLPDQDGYHVQTATRCEEHVFYSRARLPENYKSNELAQWLSDTLDSQREFVSSQVWSYLKGKVEVPENV